MADRRAERKALTAAPLTRKPRKIADSWAAPRDNARRRICPFKPRQKRLDVGTIDGRSAPDPQTCRRGPESAGVEGRCLAFEQPNHFTHDGERRRLSAAEKR